MDSRIITFGILMGREFEIDLEDGTGESCNEALLMFCPTGELEEDKIAITPRMKDLALMRFWPIAITRRNPKDTRYYKMFVTKDLSETLDYAVSSEGESLVREALEGSELEKAQYVENNYCSCLRADKGLRERDAFTKRKYGRGN
jgi:hypothetical protein